MRLLDLFCKQGGAAMGYHRAGFQVVGVDIEPQPRYPFTFIQGDALAVLADRDFVSGFDAIHASPPCQAYTPLRHRTRGGYPDLVAATREALVVTGKPWVIENVPGAPLVNPTVLCGTEFDLSVPCLDGNLRYLRRHRLFESNVPLKRAGECSCRKALIAGVYGHGGGGLVSRGYKCTRGEAAEVMGVGWMTMAGLSQAIPPAYTEHIGSFLLNAARMR